MRDIVVKRLETRVPLDGTGDVGVFDGKFLITLLKWPNEKTLTLGGNASMPGSRLILASREVCAKCTVNCNAAVATMAGTLAAICISGLARWIMLRIVPFE